MKKNPIKTMSDAELMKKLADTREELRTMRFEGAGSRLKDPHAPRKARREVEKRIEEQAASQSNDNQNVVDGTEEPQPGSVESRAARRRGNAPPAL